MLRFEIGYDRCFFFRPLTRQQLHVGDAYVGQWNLSETFGSRDLPLRRPAEAHRHRRPPRRETDGLTINTISKLHTVAHDFVDLYPYESFVQTHLENELHARAAHRRSQRCSGWTELCPPGGALVPVLRSSLIFDLKYVALAAHSRSRRVIPGRSQLAARVTSW